MSRLVLAWVFISCALGCRAPQSVLAVNDTCDAPSERLPRRADGSMAQAWTGDVLLELANVPPRPSYSQNFAVEGDPGHETCVTVHIVRAGELRCPRGLTAAAMDVLVRISTDDGLFQEEMRGTLALKDSGPGVRDLEVWIDAQEPMGDIRGAYRSKLPRELEPYLRFQQVLYPLPDGRGYVSLEEKTGASGHVPAHPPLRRPSSAAGPDFGIPAELPRHLLVFAGAGPCAVGLARGAP